MPVSARMNNCSASRRSAWKNYKLRFEASIKILPLYYAVKLRRKRIVDTQCDQERDIYLLLFAPSHTIPHYVTLHFF